MKKNRLVRHIFTNFLLYTTPNGKVKVEIFLHNENISVTQKLIASLFYCSVDNVSLHLKNIFQSSELQKSVTRNLGWTSRRSQNIQNKAL